ncbi:MAG: carboxy-S-adenosyl-L-methionine synthase CmoA [Methylomonas sp.]|nr:carboxy-S-adenosyl-L-methionine synthase CmoA [Methylomonas sp.]PPD20239.1 MAG: carboxy-S-adenosyl-L-methionine synthase CmoA [Methylomonas sp.]PPD24002.1 MAG: carboxy-S-adenosyl-L-methionine synthase CmoA [Methylomonas sp.]PPD32277.1 MAG: carboxy-S-adenosyl-L-methionine synthase CmoA [Methylomonas sp.]PPD40343.1 MAG: carboxy-S-adenosyl-L-methionine synthase CmoA [Methylomonas sp.]
MPFKKDSLYANPLGDIAAFRFDRAVVDVFPDMIERSVPGYGAIISAIGLLAGRFSQNDSVCYDLGCSLGAASLAMRSQITATNCKIVAVDNSQAMIDQLESRLQLGVVDIDVICADIRDIDIANASVVVLNFTLQFIPLCDRAALINKIYRGLLPGGVLILSEKLAVDNVHQQALHTEMHHLFKKMQGYSDLEISQKRAALENVLVAESFAIHQRRLIEAGFDSVEVWFQYFKFASMIALK